MEERNTEDLIIAYIIKYVPKEDNLYANLVEMSAHPSIEDDMQNRQNILIIDQAWQLAYRKAMDDSEMTIEERKELQSINNIKNTYIGFGQSRIALNHRLLNSFKKLYALDKKEDLEDKYEAPSEDKKKSIYPKLTPFNNDWK